MGGQSLGSLINPFPALLYRWYIVGMAASRRRVLTAPVAVRDRGNHRGGHPVRAIFVRDFELKLMMQRVSAYLIDAKTTHNTTRVHNWTSILPAEESE